MLFIINLLYLLIITLIPLLVGIAFLTLLERRSMASSQTRKGPNVVGFFGILQSIADGMKVLLKKTILPYKSSYILFCVAHFFRLMFIWIPINPRYRLYLLLYLILLKNNILLC